MSIAERYQKVAAKVAEAAMAAGRAPEDVLLVAVSKTVGPEGVAEAIEGGARDFGENRPDQIVPKSAAFPEARWHFIGNIQSRRIPKSSPLQRLSTPCTNDAMPRKSIARPRSFPRYRTCSSR